MRGLLLSFAATALMLVAADVAFAQYSGARIGYDRGYSGGLNYGTYYGTRADSGVFIFGNTTTGAFGAPAYRYPSTVIYTQPVRVTPIYNFQTPVYYSAPIYSGQPLYSNGNYARTYRWGR